MANEYNFGGSSINDMGTKATFPWATGFCAIGKISGVDNDSAVRVVNVTIPQGTSIVAATIFIYGDFVNPSSNQNIKMTIHGFAEDNTANFSSDPTGRPSTTASGSFSQTAFTNQYMGMDVTNIVQEIVNRGGWSSGNAMGFHFNNNGTADNTYIEDDASGALSPTDAYLMVLLASRPNFYPGPSSVNTPIYTPVPSSYGIKISKKGKNVFKENLKDLILDTSFPVLKAKFFGLVTTSGSGSKEITHGIGYKPAILAWGKDSNGNRMKFPGLPNVAAAGAPGIILTTASSTQIYSSNGAEVFYYIFIDDISL